MEQLPNEIIDQILRNLRKFHLSQVVFANKRLGDIATKILQERLDKVKADRIAKNYDWDDPQEEVYPNAKADVATMEYFKVCCFNIIQKLVKNVKKCKYFFP